MAIFKEHQPGTLSYVELASPDPNGSRDFYMNLFGWDVRDEDMGEHGIYTQFLKEGEVVGALYKMMKAQEDAGTPPSWALYITVTDIEAAADRCKKLGGQILMGPMDVDEHGRMCVMADTVGAVFCTWQAKNHCGLGRKDEPGTLCWAENMTSDLAKSKSFYGDFFGWVATELEMGDSGVYNMLGSSPEAPCCGMIEISPEMGPIPPHWLAYFQVDDVTASHDKAVALGAQAMVPTTTITGGSQFAVMRDPQGAHFGIFHGADQPCD